jgi:hypothetical protein
MPLGQCVIVETGCNWYLGDINICSLSKKLIKADHIDYCIHHQNINQNLEAPIE